MADSSQNWRAGSADNPFETADLGPELYLARSPNRVDTERVTDALRASANSWVQQLFPAGRKSQDGKDWRLANIHGDAPRKSGSCVIKLVGPHAGNWHDFDGNEGGGPIDTVARGKGLDPRTAEGLRRIADFAGVSAGGSPQRRDPTPAPPVPDKLAKVTAILDACTPIADTPVETYLQGRGLIVAPAADLAFCSKLYHAETKAELPAMVATVRNGAGEVVGVHRTFLAVSEDGRVCKTPEGAKKMLGLIKGGAVRLAGLGDGGRLALSEGIESGLAVATAIPELAVWATLSTSGLHGVEIPGEPRRVVILADNDESGAGLRAAERASARLRAQGHEVEIALPPAPGTDFNDLLQAGGSEAVSIAVEQATPIIPLDAPEIRRHKFYPLNFAPISKSEKQALRADFIDVEAAAAQTWWVISETNREYTWLFNFGGRIAYLTSDTEGRPSVVILNDDQMYLVLAYVAVWQRLGRKGEDLVECRPPGPMTKHLLSTPAPELPELHGIVSAPIFGADGELVTSPGYHPGSKTFYMPLPEYSMPPIPENPNEKEIAAARALIVDDLFGDFSFTSKAELAHAVALLLLGFVRPMIDGPTPIHLIEKPKPGSGATLLTDAIARITTGFPVGVLTECGDEEEWRKTLTAKLIQAPEMILIDNLRNTLDSSSLAAAITSPVWESRLLGGSKIVRVPVRCTWVATGNNPNFSNEMARRIVRIRLDPSVPEPWMRTGFRHPDLIGWINQNRGCLVAACLTLVRAWIVAGKQRGPKKLGSFEAWSFALGGILDVAGVDGFLCNTHDLIDASDEESSAWENFIGTWWDRFGTHEVTNADLFEVYEMCELPPPITGSDAHARKGSLGRAVGKMRDSMFTIDGQALRLVKTRSVRRSNRWQLHLKVRSDDSRSEGEADAEF